MFWPLLIGWPLFEISQSVAQVQCSRDTQMSPVLFGIKQPGRIIYLFFDTIQTEECTTQRVLVK